MSNNSSSVKASSTTSGEVPSQRYSPYTTMVGTVSSKFSEAASPAEVAEAVTKGKAYAALKEKQDKWRMAEKTVKDLESVKSRSADEESRLNEAKRYLLLNEKPAGAGRKTRRGKKKGKKSKKSLRRRAH